MAVPEEGYQFQGWRRAPSFLCGGRTGPCPISTQAFFGNPGSLALLRSDTSFMLEPLFQCGNDTELGGQPVCLEPENLLQGVTPIPNATIRVDVGGRLYFAPANSAGQFDLNFSAPNPADLVLVSVIGENPVDGREITYTRLLGPAKELVAEHRYSVNAVSTAHLALLRGANSGRTPASSSELRAAELQVLPGTLLDRSVAIELWATEATCELGVHAESADAIAQSDALTTTILMAAKACDPALEAVTESSLGVIQRESEGFASGVSMQYVSVSGLQHGSIQRSGEVYEFEAGDGKGQRSRLIGSLVNGISFNVIDALPEGDDHSRSPKSAVDLYNWSEEGGSLLMTYTQVSEPVIGFLLLGVPPTATDEQREALRLEQEARGEPVPVGNSRQLEATRLSRLIAGSGTDFVLIEDAYRHEYDPVVLTYTTGEVLEFPPSTRTSYRVESMVSAGTSAGLEFSEQCYAGDGTVCVPGRWLGHVHYPPVEDGSFSAGSVYIQPDIIDFAADSDSAGTATGTISRTVASWAVLDGDLLIEYADGWTQRVSILHRSGLEYGVLLESTDGVSRTVGYRVFVRGDRPGGFTERSIVNREGSYWLKLDSLPVFVLDTVNGLPLIPGVSGWELASGQDSRQAFRHQSYQLDNDDDGVLDDVLVLEEQAWSLEDGQLHIGATNVDTPSDIADIPGRDVLVYQVANTVERGHRKLYVLELDLFTDFGLAPRAVRLLETEKRDDWDFLLDELPSGDPFSL